MYDAKEIDDNGFKELNELNSNCLCDRSYYNKIVNDNSIVKLKSSYIPIENILD